MIPHQDRQARAGGHVAPRGRVLHQQSAKCEHVTDTNITRENLPCLQYVGRPWSCAGDATL